MRRFDSCMTHDGDSAKFANMSEWFRCQFASLITAVRIRFLALKLKLNNMTKRGGARVAGEGKKIGRPKTEPTKVVRIKVSELEKLRADALR